MAKINGVGGIFLKLEFDTKKLLNWYKDELELDVSEFGVNFLYPNQLTLLTFDRKGSDEAFINFTVDDIEEYIKLLKNKGIDIHKEIVVYEHGKFAQIKDIAGNIIELWEPINDVYKEMVKKEINRYN